uniref:Uncharacterized protein n=1 Tax=Chelonoidis abingdonii TaxID=106734 RepID=A0A8C0IWA3_CHEAB
MAGNPLKSLRDEATCSICLSFFTDPVTIDCGHNFCRACIAQCWERPDTDISCPQCRETFRQRTLRPNRQLGNLAEIAKQLSVPAAAAAAAGGLCNAHQEPFKLFCNQDQVLICVICRESQAHRAHRVVPIEEAAREHKEQIQIQLNTLKQEREELLEWKQDGETQSQEYLVEAERQKIVSEFEQLRQFLEEQERLLLAQLEELDKEIVKIQDEYVTKLSEEISRLSDLISEIEEKCQQPTSEFLQVRQLETPRSLEGVGVSSQRNVCLQEALKKLKGNLTVIWVHAMVMIHGDLPLTVEGDGLWHISSQLVPARCLCGWDGEGSGLMPVLQASTWIVSDPTLGVKIGHSEFQRDTITKFFRKC